MRLIEKVLSMRRGVAHLATVAAIIAISNSVAETSDTASVPSSPKEFVKGALSASEVELRAGKIAQQKGQNAAVQRLGATLVKDQEEINARLKKIAAEKNVQPQASLQPEHEKQLAAMQNASGSEFDSMFVQQVIRDHKRDLAMLKECKEKFAADSQISQLIQDHRSTVEKHLRLAQNAATELGIPTTGASASGTAAGSETSARSSRPGQQEERDAPAREGDREVLGLPTSNNDGTILGVIPAPSRTVEAGNAEESYVAEELADGKVDQGVDNVFEADQDAVAVPPTSEREKAAGEFIPDRK